MSEPSVHFSPLQFSVPSPPSGYLLGPKRIFSKNILTTVNPVFCDDGTVWQSFLQQFRGQMNPTCFFVCQIHPHSTSFLLVDMKQPTWCSSNFFQPINRGLGPLIGHMLFRYGYRGVPMRIQIRNIFACLLSLWFEKKLNIHCQALFKTPNYKVWTWKIKLALWKVTHFLIQYCCQ